MAYIFKAKSTINEHIKNIYEEGELLEDETMKKFGISEFQQKARSLASVVRVSRNTKENSFKSFGNVIFVR